MHVLVSCGNKEMCTKKHASKSHHKLLVVILLLSTSLNQGVSSAIQNLSVLSLKSGYSGYTLHTYQNFFVFQSKELCEALPSEVGWTGVSVWIWQVHVS